MTRIPLTVIGGFLGAGKTTLLNRLLQASGGRRLAVLVNDFGAINIDAALVASSAADAIALTNGCVCCSIGDDLTAALIRVLAAAPPFDAVVIEASGVSDPWRIAQIGLSDPALSLDGVVVLVDAAAVLEQSRDVLLADSLQRQLRSADLVVINKTDLVDEHALRQVRGWVSQAAGEVTVFETTQAVVPLAMLSGLAMADAHACAAPCCDHAGHAQERGGLHDPHPAHSPGESHHADHPHGHAELFDTWSHRPTQVLSAEALRTALRCMPPGILRLKGIVRTDEHGWAELQFAGRHGSLRKATAAPINGAAVVAIGLRGALPDAALEEIVASAAIGEAGEA